MSDKGRNADLFWVLFVATGEKFPVRYYETSDTYAVTLPTGIYEGEFLADLKRELRADFEGVRITNEPNPDHRRGAQGGRERRDPRPNHQDDDTLG